MVAKGQPSSPDAAAVPTLREETSEEPPVIEQPNVYPVEWNVESLRLDELYARAKQEAWDPAKIAWQELNPRDYDDRQRIAMCYWWALLANFENSGAPAFAQAMINTWEHHFENPTKKLLASIVMDECRHDECCMRACRALCPSWPETYKPKNEFERRALNNVRWVYYNGARYWNGYKQAYQKYSFPVIFSSFMMGEACAKTLFTEMSRKSNHPAFEQALKNIARDESRHYAFTWLSLENTGPSLTSLQKEQITKQIRAGFVFLSMILYEPPRQFWRIPANFHDVHNQMEGIARDAGLGILTLEEKRQAWRGAILEVKKRVKQFEIAFPDLPEIDVYGDAEVEVDEVNVVPTF